MLVFMGLRELLLEPLFVICGGARLHDGSSRVMVDIMCRAVHPSRENGQSQAGYTIDVGIKGSKHDLSGSW